MYDFEAGPKGWDLGSGWSWQEVEGGHALQAAGQGDARLLDKAGSAFSLRFRFRLSDYRSTFGVSLFENIGGGVRGRYFVVFTAQNDVGLWRQTGGYPDPQPNLGSRNTPMDPTVFHEALIQVGGGSIDISVDGELVLGADDPTPLPPGGVSFNSWADLSVVHVDDVEIKFGTEPTPHPRAPRSSLTLAPGPDVGPFVGGIHNGDLLLTGNETLTLSTGRYTLREGEIELSGHARLRILKGAALVFDRGTVPLAHWGIYVADTAAVEIDGGDVLGVGATVFVFANGHSSVTVRNAKPWIHFIVADGNATVAMDSSRFVTGAGGSIQLGQRGKVTLRDSQVGAIALALGDGATLEGGGLGTGRFADFDLQRDFKTAGVYYDLRMQNVELVPDRLGTGPFERGWVFFAREATTMRLSNSVIRKLVMTLAPSGPDVAVSGLRLEQPVNLGFANIQFSNVTVTGQWGFSISGTRRAVFDDVQGFWPFVYDQAQVVVRNSSMNEFDPRHFRGTMTFENSEWNGIGEVIDRNAFVLAGSLNVTGRNQGYFSWYQSAVTRQFEVRILDQAGKPAGGVTITLTRGDEAVSATTGPNGDATVTLTFSDQDYRKPWKLTSSLGYPALEVDFFTSSPITVANR